jgi:hypothetical protein
MGRLPDSAVEARLAATLFLLVLGLADIFGALQVRQFAAFTPRGVAASMGSAPHVHGMDMPVDPDSLNEPVHHIDRELLVQDTHVHVPAYAMTAAFLSLIVLGLRLSSSRRVLLIGAAFAAPVLDFAGLWGAHLFNRSAAVWGAVALVGGFAMGAVYLFVLVLTLTQCWFNRKDGLHA